MRGNINFQIETRILTYIKNVINLRFFRGFWGQESEVTEIIILSSKYIYKGYRYSRK